MNLFLIQYIYNFKHNCLGIPILEESHAQIRLRPVNITNTFEIRLPTKDNVFSNIEMCKYILNSFKYSHEHCSDTIEEEAGYFTLF